MTSLPTNGAMQDAWERHITAEFESKNIDDTMAMMTAYPLVNHVSCGAAGCAGAAAQPGCARPGARTAKVGRTTEAIAALERMTPPAPAVLNQLQHVGNPVTLRSGIRDGAMVLTSHPETLPSIDPTRTT